MYVAPSSPLWHHHVGASHMVCRVREVSDIPQESQTAAWPIRNVLPGRDFRLMERSGRLP